MSASGRRFLVTGGAGFIGSHLCDGLAAAGDRPVVLDDLSSGRRENLAQLGDAVEIHEGSIADPEAVARATENVQGIFHLAAMPSVARSLEAPLESNHANVTGTVTVLDAARSRGLKVVYAGSSSAYGDQEVVDKREDLRESPLSPYAAAKLAGELYCRVFANVYGITTVVTRFFNVFGPRQVPDSPYSGVIAAYCLAALRDSSPRVDGDGKQSRDFTYVADVVRGLRLAMDTELEGHHTVNLACGGSHDLLALLAALRSCSGAQLEPTFAPPRTGDVRHSQADVSRARELLGFQAEVSFAEGVERTFDWYRSEWQ